MVIKVDLACEKCRKKIKKVFCSIPQIQNQMYDEKANTVTITVVCCSPEKIKKKICCKGGESIKGIEIKEPEKPKPDKPKEAEKPKELAKPKEKPKEPEKKEPKPDKHVVIVEPTKPKAPEPTPKPAKPASKPPAPAPKAPEPAPKAPQLVSSYPPPIMPCCMDPYGGHGVGPCLEGYGRPPPCYESYGTPAPLYEAYGRPVYDSWGGGYAYYGGCRRGCYVGRCDCMSETSPSTCGIM